MKCVTVVGTRPEFIQTSLVSRSIRERDTEIFVNTGQHYDDAMSQVFFRELNVPAPEVNLDVGTEGATHAEQTGLILMKIEPLLVRERPDWVIVFGDTNSTIAGALAAAKLNLRVAHIEAGLRSFDRTMPEEVNRVLTDHISDVLLCPTAAAVENLKAEGIVQNVLNVGDVRVDVLNHFLPSAVTRRAGLLSRAGLADGAPFALATIHRASNTDEPARLKQIISAFEQLPFPVLLPIHPRLRKMLERNELVPGPNIRAFEPLGFLDLLALLDASSIVVTDSGGLQKEAYMLRRPCVTLRDTTEWIETVHAGWNRLAEPGRLADAVAEARTPPDAHPDLYGTPGVGARIVAALQSRVG